MKNYIIKNTEITPAIEFDFKAKKLSFKGVCAPENSTEFFNPILAYLNEYAKEQKELLVEFDFDYFNTGTSKCLLDLLIAIKKEQNISLKSQINWYIDKEDDEMKESAEIFEELTGLTFNYITSN